MANYLGHASDGYSDFSTHIQRPNFSVPPPSLGVKISTPKLEKLPDMLNQNVNEEIVGGVKLTELYQKLEDGEIDIEIRLSLFKEVEKVVRERQIPFTRIANKHVLFCTVQAKNFCDRAGIGVLENNERLLVPAMTLLREGLLMGDETLITVASKSQLLPYLAKMVMTFAERTDLMTKNLSKMCALDSLLGVTQIIHPFGTLDKLLEVPSIPESFAITNTAKKVDLQHRYDCECIDCKELPNKPQSPNGSPFTLLSGIIGTLVYPLRNLPRHIAAICPVMNYWELLESRSVKIAEAVAQHASSRQRRGHDLHYRGRVSHMFVSGQQVAVHTESLAWISYEATSPTAPKLPDYLRGFVIGECPLPLANPLIGLWLPDYAAMALCSGDKLVNLPEFSKVRAMPPLLFLANACPATPDEAVEIAVDLIYILILKSNRIDQIQSMLDDKGPWKTVQLLRYLRGEFRVKLLFIINKMTKDFERGSRGVIACCIHQLLADWLLWSAYTQRMTEMEKETVVEGLIQFVPRIDVRKWLKRPLLLHAVNALLRDVPSGNLQTLLNKCRDLLVWDPTNRGIRRGGGNFSSGRQWQPRDNRERDLRDRDVQLKEQRERRQEIEMREEKVKDDARCEKEEQEEEEEVVGNQVMLHHSEYNIGRRPRPGESWYSITKVTLSMVVALPIEPVNAADVLRSKNGKMLMDKLYKPAQQGVHCELVKARFLREVRQPLLARLMCGLLNSGGGQIYIGLGEQGLIEGVRASRPERDSFTQGVLDVSTYSLDPRLMPFSFELERRIVLKTPDFIPDDEWNRFVFILNLKPLPNTVYSVLPEKQSFIRRPPHGITVCLNTAKKYDESKE